MFKIPKTAIEYILLQRSEVDRKNIAETFTNQIKSDFEQVLPFLPKPENVRTILDIGCGIGGINIFMAKHFSNAEVHLYDKTAVEDKVWYGFKKRAAFYNSLEEAKRFISVNGVDENRIFTHSIPEQKPRISVKNPDIITSFKSWGFHFPVSEYIPDLKHVINSQCSLIIDVRKRHVDVGKSELFKIFNHIKPICDDRKHIRFIAKNPKLT